MDPAAGEGGGGMTPPFPLSPQGATALGEGISLVFARWTALQMAVQNQWGGRNSSQKADDLASSVLSWFVESKGPLYIDDLENMLEMSMIQSFNAEIDDGSVEEVAEELMIMHDECIKGNYGSIENLKRSHPAISAASQCIRVTYENEDESSSDEEISEMAVDEPAATEVAVEKTNSKQMPDEDGWSTVASRRNKGKGKQ